MSYNITEMSVKVSVASHCKFALVGSVADLFHQGQHYHANLYYHTNLQRVVMTELGLITALVFCCLLLD